MELAPWAEAAGARSGEAEWVEMEGGIVPICPSLSVHRGTRVEPRVGQLVVWVGLAGQLAGRLTVWVGGGEGRSVISVMIFMDVSQNKALAELEANQSPIHLHVFSLSAAILLHPGTICLVLIFTINAVFFLPQPNLR